MNEVTKLAVSFVLKNFNKISLKRIDSEHYAKKSFIKNIKEDYYIACWVLTEVMSWGADKDYIKEYQVKNEEDIFAIKIDSKYFKINYQTFLLDECKPKYKIVTCF